MIHSWLKRDIDAEIKSLRKAAKALVKSKKKSREFLIRAGIITITKRLGLSGGPFLGCGTTTKHIFAMMKQPLWCRLELLQ